jgi:hypothetical protein
MCSCHIEGEGIIAQGREIVQVPHIRRRNNSRRKRNTVVQVPHRRRRNYGRRKRNSAGATYKEKE